ncbi:hypothetical protein [Fredinandcohnia onubensis]|uniref:hypothetical protein n=1 Tax=Fredinandcohnia onubensis TaxID=1571209 RepID=UPI000C0BD28E|nr:hypothetical protein [Fredinandcohnia onubensis]
MKKSISDENIMLKQKLIHYQSEVSKYKERLKKYEKNAQVNQNTHSNDNNQILEDQVTELKQRINTLMQQVEELKTENRILRSNGGAKNQEINFDQGGKKQSLNSWFVNNLENQNAIKRHNRPLNSEWDHDKKK